MKTNYRFFYVISLLALLVMGCGEDPTSEEENDGTGGSGSGEELEMYFPPVGTDWTTVSAKDIGWNVANLDEAIRYAKENRSYNLLILYKGRIVSENYWRETTIDSLHELNSVAKSMMSFVIGVLQTDGTIALDNKVSDYLPAGWSLSPATEPQITVRHLLTMTSGLNEELKWVGNPGETWRYSDHAYKVLYDVISAATGQSYRKVFDELLFSKIGMTKYTWSGHDLLSSAREISRFGLMVLNDGVWNGEKLIQDDGYYNAMLSTSQTIQQAYGYLWWLNGKDTYYDGVTKTTYNGSIASSMPDDALLAKGKHDQRIYVVPSLDLVVIRQGMITDLPEVGEGSFDVEFWKRLMNAIGAGALPKN